MYLDTGWSSTRREMLRFMTTGIGEPSSSSELAEILSGEGCVAGELVLARVTTAGRTPEFGGLESLSLSLGSGAVEVWVEGRSGGPAWRRDLQSTRSRASAHACLIEIFAQRGV
eukprot:CAMPEP_0173170044 /NCGR_PEP_ID=MMETSP1141-20130122/1028_1 /TAXON_ID=483371 /ORGANISM="non described non described, Strain CCMP2298" /LENGTH=113 /DNA_ID=CAMNT_0014091913 /DNA_START=45 /DNA_END=381 /DNA_ORIENTATION=-